MTFGFSGQTARIRAGRTLKWLDARVGHQVDAQSRQVAGLEVALVAAVRLFLQVHPAVMSGHFGLGVALVLASGALIVLLPGMHFLVHLKRALVGGGEAAEFTDELLAVVMAPAMRLQSPTVNAAKRAAFVVALQVCFWRNKDLTFEIKTSYTN